MSNRTISRLVLAAVFLLTLGPTGSCIAMAASLQQWLWVRLEPNSNPDTSPNSWISLQGRTDVEFLPGGHFRAKLYHDDAKFELHYTLEGKITGDRVVARETHENTDASGLYQLIVY